MRPKFEVGEVVLLQSKSYPELNGECTVKAVVGPNETVKAEDDSGVTYSSPNYTYSLDVSVMHNGGLTSHWQESALRKKHTPGELSFTDLMASLSSPKLITHTP